MTDRVIYLIEEPGESHGWHLSHVRLDQGAFTERYLAELRIAQLNNDDEQRRWIRTEYRVREVAVQGLP